MIVNVNIGAGLRILAISCYALAIPRYLLFINDPYLKQANLTTALPALSCNPIQVQSQDSTLEYTSGSIPGDSLMVVNYQADSFPYIRTELEGVKCIRIRMPNLKELPTWVCSLPSLESLALLNCTQLDMQSVVNLVLSNPDIKHLEIKGARGLEQVIVEEENTSLCNLDIRNNQLKRLPQFVSKLKALRQAAFSQNPLNDIQSLIPVLDSIQSLKLSIVPPNVIALILSEITFNNSLQTLYIHNCGLRSFPNDINKLKQLEVLVAGGNSFTELPESILELENLKWLDVVSCEITNIPAFILDMDSLRQLSVIGNPIPQDTVLAIRETIKRRSIDLNVF